MIKAVLFDFDGVWTDSMPAHVKAWQTVFGKLGVQVAGDEILQREGMRSLEMAREIVDLHDVAITTDELKKVVDEKQGIYREEYRVTIAPDIGPLLYKLRKYRLATALVTGSPLRNVRHAVPDGLFNLLDVVITADDVDSGKPDPLGYLKASTALGVAPAQCLVVENAPLGVEAARRAGMQIVALTTTLPARHLNKADNILPNLEELSMKIDAILTSGEVLVQ